MIRQNQPSYIWNCLRGFLDYASDARIRLGQNAPHLAESQFDIHANADFCLSAVKTKNNDCSAGTSKNSVFGGS